MTLYVLDLTVPANTPQDRPAEGYIDVEEEVVLSVECRFPSGCRGMVYTAVYYGKEQVFPRPFGQFLHGDGETIRWQEHYILPESPCRLTVRAWSPGTKYSHTVTWRISALPLEVAEWWYMIDKLISLLSKLFRVRV